MRVASRSIASGSSRASRARAWPGREHAGGHPALHAGRQAQQAQRVAHLRPAAADPRRELVLGAAEVVEHLLVGRRLLQRVELGAVQVLEQGVAQQDVVGGLAHDRRGSRSRPASRPARQRRSPGHELVVRSVGAGVGRRAHHDRLQQPDLADRVDQLGERVLVEDRARLARVGPDVVERQLGVAGAGDDLQVVAAMGLGAADAARLPRRARSRRVGAGRSPPEGMSAPRPRPSPRRWFTAAPVRRASSSVGETLPRGADRPAPPGAGPWTRRRSSASVTLVRQFLDHVGGAAGATARAPAGPARGPPRGRTARPCCPGRRSSRSGRRTAPRRPGPSGGSPSAAPGRRSASAPRRPPGRRAGCARRTS